MGGQRYGKVLLHGSRSTPQSIGAGSILTIDEPIIPEVRRIPHSPWNICSVHGNRAHSVYLQCIDLQMTNPADCWRSGEANARQRFQYGARRLSQEPAAHQAGPAKRRKLECRGRCMASEIRLRLRRQTQAYEGRPRRAAKATDDRLPDGRRRGVCREPDSQRSAPHIVTDVIVAARRTQRSSGTRPVGMHDGLCHTAGTAILAPQDTTLAQ
jgi:hypothetical protein